MSTEELNGEEQQIPVEDITEQQESDLQTTCTGDDVNDADLEQPVDQSTEEESSEIADGGDENMDTSQPQSVTSGEGDSGLPETYAGGDIPYDERKLFVGGLSWETSEARLREYFGKYGTVVDVKLKQDPQSGKSRGFAFVVFDDDTACKKALDDGPHKIDGKTVDTKKAIPHAIHQALKNRTKKIFVGGVPTNMSEETIRSYFQQFGDIEEVALVTDKGSTKRRGFCFVTFISEESVDKCTDKSFHQIEDVQVEVKRATPRDQTFPNRGGRGGRGGGGGGHGGMRGGFGRGGYVPYGPYGGYYAAPAPYGGYGGYGGIPQHYGGMHHYGAGGYDGGFYSEGGRGGGPGGYGSRYGPMKGGYNHGGGSSYHPYSR